MFRGYYGYCAIHQPEQFEIHGKKEIPNGQDTVWIVNRSRHACQKCNHEAKQNIKDRYGKKSTTGIRQGRKRSQQHKHTYQTVWNTNPHVCTGCLQPIRDPSPTNFSHTIPKGWSDKNGYPELRNDPKNITLKCKFGKGEGQPGCHFIQDFGTIEQQSKLLDYEKRMRYIKETAIEYYRLLILNGHNEI